MGTLRERGHEWWDLVHAKLGGGWTWFAVISVAIALLVGVAKLVAENAVANWIERPVMIVASWLWHLQAGPLLVIVAAWLMLIGASAAIESSPVVRQWVERRRAHSVFGEMEILRAENARLEQQHKDDDWRYQYLIDRPRVLPLSAEAIASARRELSCLHSTLKTLVGALSPVLERVCEAVRWHKGEGVGFVLSRQINGNSFAPTLRAIGLLRDIGTTLDADPREAFTTFCKRYERLKVELISDEMTQLMGKPVIRVEGYRAWVEADRELFALVNRLPNVPETAELHEAIRESRLPTHKPVMLPPPEPPSTPSTEALPSQESVS